MGETIYMIEYDNCREFEAHACYCRKQLYRKLNDAINVLMKEGYKPVPNDHSPWVLEFEYIGNKRNNYPEAHIQEMELI